MKVPYNSICKVLKAVFKRQRKNISESEESVAKVSHKTTSIFFLPAVSSKFSMLRSFTLNIKTPSLAPVHLYERAMWMLPKGAIPIS